MRSTDRAWRGGRCAAVLIALAALVVPLTTGPPSSAQNVPAESTPLRAAPAASVADLPLGSLDGTPSPSSHLLGCERAHERVTVSGEVHLDPSCTWTAGFDIATSDTVLDCRGATVARPTTGGVGVLVEAPERTALENVLVRNCHISGFLNNIKLTRQGFRSLTPDDGYDHEFSNVVVRNVRSFASHGVGIFVDGFVSGVTIEDTEVAEAGSVGIYLETDSRRTTVQRSHIHANGHRENGPAGRLWTIGATQVWFWGTGREGIAIDGSSENRIAHNIVEDNVAGGIFVYKNCGEYPERNPDRWWPRFSGSHDNVIERNTIRGEDHGVWVASRQAENQFFMECTDDAYGTAPLVSYHLDPAERNIVRHNVFDDVLYGVRVEDDHTQVVGNSFTSERPAALAVVVGTKVRAELAGRPVAHTLVTGNDADLAGVDHPYRWIPSQVDSTFGPNRSRGSVVGWCEGAQPRINQALFVVAAASPPPQDLTPPPPLPPVAQPACPAGVDPTTGAVAGTVTDTEGDPLGDVTVLVGVPGDTGSIRATTTDVDGTFSVEDLAEGEYRVHFTSATTTATCYLDDPFCNPIGRNLVRVDAGATTTGIDARLAIADGGSISGAVTDRGGDPIAGVQVWVVTPGFSTMRLALTDGAGRYTVAGLGDGTYFIWFNAAGIGSRCWPGPGCGASVPTTIVGTNQISGRDATF
ncbi:MAG: right-handed parallel beta-helix repeat-containing protein [Acidimicrobiia bacterium]|nr:right-handed parallel beta-helix repeat-containing protein [Acidimicrobiia bacterium]